MPRTKRKRSKIAKLRACLFDGKPWSIMHSALSVMTDAFEVGDIGAIEASLTFGSEVDSETKIVNGVAVIPVTGVLRDEVDYMVRYGYATSYQLLEREIRQAVENAQVKAVVLFMGTPGGSAIGCKRVADTILSLRGSKPIVAYGQSVCGSAGYYIASACDRMEGTADSLWGSIGTIYNHIEASEAYKDFGYGVTVITNKRSPNKGHGNQFEPLSEDARQTLGAFIDSYGEGFIGDVAKYRNTTPDQVVASFGQGDAFRADIALTRGMVDKIVPNFQTTLDSISSASSAVSPVAEAISVPMSATGQPTQAKGTEMKISKRIRAQLFVQGLITDMDVSDELCQAAMSAWFAAKGIEQPSDEASVIGGLQASAAIVTAENSGGTGDTGETGADTNVAQNSSVKRQKLAANVQEAHENEMGEARLADLQAAAALVNQAAGYDAVSADMVLSAFTEKLKPSDAMSAWNKTLSSSEPSIPAARVRLTGTGADQFAADAIDAMVYRSSDNPSMELSDGAASMASMPLWAVAGRCLELSGASVDMYGARELLAEQAMSMGDATRRVTFFGGNEDRRYVQASGIPASRPGDFPNILSGLANKFLDSIQLDDDYSYPEVSAVLPGGLNDFRPAMMANKGIVEELDELTDAEQLKELGLKEEVLSYIFLRRFGNKFGWTPVMVANDDMNAFAEGMLGLAEAWQVTQNRMVVDRFTSNENLLDGHPLFANRPDTGVGQNKAKNDNLRTGGGVPSDAEWEAMEDKYADIGGIATGRRVRGTLNTIFTPTGTITSEATRHFASLNVVGESKNAGTTANLGLYRGKVSIVPESELRVNSKTTYYGLRNPTRLNTATVVRGYFNGYGTAGRRERWYDPTNKTTYVSLEGRIATAVKNWRYAMRNEE